MYLKLVLHILKGLSATLLISLGGLVLGTLFGAGLCWMKRGKNKFLRGFSVGFITVVRGSPVLLLLMILYYVVFYGVMVNPWIIAILAFGLNSGAHIAEIMYAALEGVNKMQVEAARMLGFSKTRAFVYIAFPQAVKIALPVYQSAIISLVQWTSVVGYVAINDLTRSVNIIGDTLGQPFLALFVGVMIYLAISYCVHSIFRLTEKRGAHK